MSCPVQSTPFQSNPIQSSPIQSLFLVLLQSLESSQHLRPIALELPLIFKVSVQQKDHLPAVDFSRDFFLLQANLSFSPSQRGQGISSTSEEKDTSAKDPDCQRSEGSRGTWEQGFWGHYLTPRQQEQHGESAVSSQPVEGLLQVRK